jgi:hypothetical protein
MAGVVSGLKSMGKGVAVGVSTVIAGPIVGAKEKGISGFFGGLLGGVVAGAGIIATGVGVGSLSTSKASIKSEEELLILLRLSVKK